MTNIVLIKPSSINDIYGDEYSAKEFTIMWLSPTGGLRTWFFSDTEQKQDTSYKHIQVDTRIGGYSIIKQKEDKITLTETGLNFDNFKYLRSLLASERAWILGELKTDRTHDRKPIQISDGKARMTGDIDDYSLEITIIKR